MEREKLIAIIDKAIDEHQTLCAEIIADAILEATQPILTDEDVKAWEDIKKEERKLGGAELHERLTIYESIHQEQNKYIDCLKDKLRKLKKEKGA